MSADGMDILNLRADPKVLAVVRSYDPRGEEGILYSEYVIKYNHRDKAQQRVLALTNKAIYNLEGIGAKAKCKRRIPLEIIGSISSTSDAGASSNEFVVHIPTQYDYRYVSTKRDPLLDLIAKHYEIIKGKKVRRNWSPNASLQDICITRRMNRDERARVFDRQDKLSQVPPTAGGGGGGGGGGGAPALPAAGGAAAGGGGGGARATSPDGSGEMYTGWSKEASPVNLESFNLVKVIGRGSFGKVFLAQKKAGHDANRFYALKVLSKKVIIERNQVEHTLAEKQVMETITHPFLMKLHYTFQNATKLYFVMDYLNGGELFFHLRKVRRFDVKRARFYAAEIALGACLRACVRACACVIVLLRAFACERACVRAWVCARVRARAYVHICVHSTTCMCHHRRGSEASVPACV